MVAENEGLVALNLVKGFKKRPILRGVSLTLQRGEVVGLLGPNGAGKTTCFYIITGLLVPDGGCVMLDGHDITDLPMYRRARLGIGYLPQEASIFRGLSVEQNIRAVLEIVEPDRARREEIARALASAPKFVLLDEPLAGIDPIAIGEIRELVAHLKHRGIGVLITDHNVRDTLEIVDRAYIIHDGTVLMEGEPKEIVAHQEVRRVYLGERFSL